MVNENGELCKGEVGIVLRSVLHGETISGKGVGGVGGEDFGEGGNLVHELMVASGRAARFSAMGLGDLDLTYERSGDGA